MLQRLSLQTERMHTALSSYALVGIEAVPVGVIVDGDHVKVVEPVNGRTLHSVRPDKTEPVSSLIEHIVNSRTSPDRKTRSSEKHRGPILPNIAIMHRIPIQRH